MQQAGHAPKFPGWALAATTLALALACCGPAHASAGRAVPVLGGFSGRPLDPSGNPTLRSYFRWRVPAGGRQVGVLLVSNNEAAPVRLRVYAVDAVTGTTSGAVYLNGGVPPKLAGMWLTPDRSVMTVPARSTRTVRFVARVPRNAIPGDHLAAIALEDTDHPRTAHGAVAIIQVIRSAVAVEIRVPGPAWSALRPTGLALRALPGTQIASAVVHLRNSGRLLCRPVLSVTLAGAGTPPTTTTRQLNLFLPDTGISFPLAWPRPLAAGEYAVDATTSGCGPTESLRGSIDLATSLSGDSPAAARPATPPAHGSFPWWLLVVVGVGGLLLGLLLSRRRPGGATASGA